MTINIEYLLLSIVCAAGLILLPVKKLSPILFSVLMLLPVTMIYFFWNQNNRIFSAHGFMHVGIVYQISNGHLPPLNPLLSGTPLLYPWGFHLFSAIILKISSLSPFLIFPLINLISLFLTVACLYKISKEFLDDRGLNYLSVLFSIYGITPFTRDLSLLLENHLLNHHLTWPIPSFEVIYKFNNITGMPLGIGLFTFSYYAVCKLLQEKKSVRWAAMLFLSSLLTGFVYPMLTILLFSSSGLLFFVIRLNRKLNKNELRACGSILLSAFILIPYFWSLTNGRPASVGMGIHYGIKSIHWALRYAVYYIPIALLSYWNRIKIYEVFSRNRELSTFYLTTLISCLFLSILINSEQYKYFIIMKMLSGITIGFLVGFSTYRNKTIGILITFCLLLPAASLAKYRIEKENWYGKKTIYKEAGLYLKHANKYEEELLGWIRANTTGQDTFFDSEITIPPFSGRSLYIAYPEKRISGYYFPINKLKGGLAGCDPKLIKKRRNLLKTLLWGEGPLPNGIVENLKSENKVLGGSFFIVVRTPHQKARVFNQEHFQKVFENEKLMLLKLI